MIFLLQAGQDLWQVFSDILWTLLDNSNTSQNSFLSDVRAVVGNALQNFIMELSRQFYGADFADDAKHQSDNAVVGTC